MKSIEIDDQIYSFLQANSIPFVETKPADTLRRLLGITNSPPNTNSSNLDLPLNITQERLNTNLSNFNIRTKKRKTNLPELIRAGKLQEGQKLILQDYRGNQYTEYNVILSGSSIFWENRAYSMSDLAQTLLNKHGYNNDFVRGPIFWVTNEGKTIADLWDEYLKLNT